jgi:uncharacterized membrane protein YheB (UPF0754 family)
VGSFLKRDLGPLSSLVHSSYKHYFDIGIKTLAYQVKEAVLRYLYSQTCSDLLSSAVDTWTDVLMSRELNHVLPAEKRDVFYRILDKTFSRTANTRELDRSIETMVWAEISKILAAKKSLQDMLPDSMQHVILDSMRGQAPLLLDKAAEMISDPQVRQTIVATGAHAIEEFMATLGPLSAMAKSFLPRELIEEKIQDYLEENSEQIKALITSENAEIRVAAALTERGRVMLQTPLADVLHHIDGMQLEGLSLDLSRMVVEIVQKKKIARLVSGLIRSHLEASCEQGNKRIGDISRDMIGDRGVEPFKDWLKREILALVQSPGNRQVVEVSIDTLIAELVAKPIGRLDHIIPTGVRTGLYQSLQNMATTMLVSEVPGVVKSINIRKIVSDKIDSFDLLRLEKLLLSIMEEQFKYINLFGGLLGFLIGCINVLVIFGLNL